MKTRLIFTLLFVASLSFTSCKKNNGCAWSEKAWVRDFTDTDTCGIVFQLEDGTKLEPTNLAKYQGGNIQFVEGELIWLSYKDADGASTCGLGDIVEIRCISEREY